jgi:hypothetical protein
VAKAEVLIERISGWLEPLSPSALLRDLLNDYRIKRLINTWLGPGGISPQNFSNRFDGFWGTRDILSSNPIKLSFEFLKSLAVLVLTAKDADDFHWGSELIQRWNL